MSRFSTVYEPRVVPVRAALEGDHALSAVLAEGASPVLVECFLIEWFARAPYLEQPSPRWSRRAAEQCEKVGLGSVGRSFREDASREDGRDPLSIADARTLARLVSARRGVTIDVDALLAERPTVAMRAFRVLNDEVLAADLPVGYAAIGYEIERATSALCLSLILRAQRALGFETAERLRWLYGRVPRGLNRAARFAGALEETLDELPAAAEQLAEIGAGALDIYRHFLRDCVEAATARARAITGEAPSPSQRPPRSSGRELQA